ncbi:hypothetical protein Ahy_A01g000925 [Arachis hypogaea]|uniref:Endonuclease/exonuclease/phosphatase domain-containing protein n=1 Tax=Arachis hypogaea TaxID=3818 RepID=A0A445ELJ4_ARAHY|nr:hypothetical protein Ahy_A01g000925 [Arachis hypogaea]
MTQQEFREECLNLVGKMITNKELAFKIIKNTLIGVWGNPEAKEIGNKIGLVAEAEDPMKECKNSTAMSTWNPKEPRYSAGLGVTQARALKLKEYRVSREESSSWQNQREVAREEHDWRKEGESTQKIAGSQADNAQEKEWGIEEDSIAEAPKRTGKEDHRDVKKEKNILEDLLVRKIELEEVERDARDYVKESKDIKGSKKIYEKDKKNGWAKIVSQEEDNNLTIRQPLKKLNNMAKDRMKVVTRENNVNEAQHNNKRDHTSADGDHWVKNKELEQDNKKIYTTADGGVYYVELANEDEELEPNNSKAFVVATEYEIELVRGIEKKLKLKRKREDKQQLLMGDMFGEKAALQVWKAGERNKRREQWKKITATNYNKVEPQPFIGDFNDILTQEEKMGLHPKPHSQVREFRNFVDSNFLMDLYLKGGRFTWFGNPRNGFVTREMIDRALVNWEWRLLFENASLSTMPAISSDHCPLILDPKPVYKISKSFKFEVFWADHKECENIVKK